MVGRSKQVQSLAISIILAYAVLFNSNEPIDCLCYLVCSAVALFVPVSMSKKKTWVRPAHLAILFYT
jgi:hypothetical protein